MTSVALIGECMIELSPSADGRYGLAYAGDVCNTAVALSRRTADDGVDVRFVTRIGDDRHSHAMVALWRREGIDTSLVELVPGRAPGLYMISLQDDGERSFTYYRSESPARELFGDPAAAERLAAALRGTDWVFLSAITLSLLDDAGHGRLLSLLDELRGDGSRVAVDTNYRPAGWPDRDLARARVSDALARADLALPTLDDEMELFGDEDLDACVRRYRDLGAEVAIKLGGDGACVLDGGEPRRVPPQEDVKIVDSTGAGDAFNAAYLAARLAGADPVRAAAAGNALAAETLGHRGAIPGGREASDQHHRATPAFRRAGRR